MTDNNKTNQYDQNSRGWSNTRSDQYSATGKAIDSDAVKKNQSKQDQKKRRDGQDQRDMSRNNYSSQRKSDPSDENCQRR